MIPYSVNDPFPYWIFTSSMFSVEEDSHLNIFNLVMIIGHFQCIAKWINKGVSLNKCYIIDKKIVHNLINKSLFHFVSHGRTLIKMSMSYIRRSENGAKLWSNSFHTVEIGNQMSCIFNHYIMQNPMTYTKIFIYIFPVGYWFIDYDKMTLISQIEFELIL